MATGLSSQNENEQSLEMFCLIWLDSNPHESRNTEQKLRSVINQLKKFQDVDQCQEFIRKTTAKGRLILIVSGRLGREIVPKINSFRQVIAIYIYCMDKKANELWSAKYAKVKGVITNLEELVSVITEDHQIEKKVEEPLAINIFSVGGKSTSGVNGKFIFSQVLIDCLLRLKSNEQDKNELIQLLKQQYQENQTELTHINDFNKNYRSNKALQWYTKECFFYKTLNSILRNEDIHGIFLYRSFIFDLQQQLQQNQSDEILTVYRAQIISKDELENLKKSENQFISINSFFSTSLNYTKALSFLKPSKSTTENTEKVLFVIQADPNIGKIKPFAQISQFSDYPEEEVLFMGGSIFQLRNISLDYKNQFSIIEMTLSSDDDNQLKQVLFYMKQQIGEGETNLRILAKILSKTGQFKLAEKYLNRMLEQISEKDPERGNLYEDIGELMSQTGRLDDCMTWHNKSIEFKKTYPNISSSIQLKGQLKKNSRSQLKSSLKWKPNATTIAGGNGDGDKLNQLNSPHAIYVDDQQQAIYIADCGNHRIIKWDLGENYAQIVAGGHGKGKKIDQLDRPTDVIVDKNKKSLIICDKGNRRVVRWSLDNQRNKQIIIENIACLGLTTNENGDLFVSDVEKNEVQRWRKGETEGTIVTGGNNRAEQLNYPTYIFIDRQETLYVSDCFNHRVMKWMKGAKEGVLVAGGYGEGDSLKQLSNPMGLIVNEVGDIYVADSRNDRIMCWRSGSKEGRIVVGGNGDGQGSNQLCRPTGLSFDGENNLYVVDWGNNRIQRFSVDQN